MLEAEGLTKGYGDRLLMEDLSFSVPPGGIVGVIGANGAGKTTLFRMIVGQEEPDAGRLRLGDTVRAGLRRPVARRPRPGARPSGRRSPGGQDLIRLGGREEVNSRAYVASFNFRGSDQQKPVGQLSGGERNRVHLAKLLAGGGNLILLDEPTNDLDVNTLRALEEALVGWSGSALITSHDRWFLDRMATHILAFEGDSAGALVRGQLRRVRGAPAPRRSATRPARPKRITYRKLTTPT